MKINRQKRSIFDKNRNLLNFDEIHEKSVKIVEYN